MSEAITAPEDDLTVITTHARTKTDISHIHEF